MVFSQAAAAGAGVATEGFRTGLALMDLRSNLQMRKEAVARQKRIDELSDEMYDVFLRPILDAMKDQKLAELTGQVAAADAMGVSPSQAVEQLLQQEGTETKFKGVLDSRNVAESGMPGAAGEAIRMGRLNVDDVLQTLMARMFNMERLSPSAGDAFRALLERGAVRTPGVGDSMLRIPPGEGFGRGGSVELTPTERAALQSQSLIPTPRHQSNLPWEEELARLRAAGLGGL